MDEYVSRLNEYDMTAIWSGQASQAQQDEYETLMIELVKCSEDVKDYERALELKAQYELKADEIENLWNQVNSCTCRYREDGGECNNCRANLNRIYQLQLEKEQLYNQIAEILIKFDVVLPDYSNVEVREIEKIYAQMEEINFPLYNQMDYDDVEYHSGRSIAEEGCGITCAAMVISAYTGQKVTPDMLVSQIDWNGNDTTLNRALNAYGIKNANNNFLTESSGSHYEYVDGGFNEIGKNAIYYDEVKQKISEGYIAIFQMNKGTFTDGTHFVLVTGINEDGNFIIQDPNGNNYIPTTSQRSQVLQNGFENGFTDEDIKNSWSGCYLIEPYDEYTARNQG